VLLSLVLFIMHHSRFLCLSFDLPFATRWSRARPPRRRGHDRFGHAPCLWSHAFPPAKWDRTLFR